MSGENPTDLFSNTDDDDDGYEIDATYAKSRIKPITNTNNSMNSNNSNDGSPIRRKYYETLSSNDNDNESKDKNDLNSINSKNSKNSITTNFLTPPKDVRPPIRLPHDISDSSISLNSKFSDVSSINNNNEKPEMPNVTSKEMPLMHSPSARGHAYRTGRSPGGGTHSMLNMPAAPKHSTWSPSGTGSKFGKNKIHIAPLVDHNRSNEYEFDVNGEPYKMVQIILAGLRQAVETAEQPIAFLSFNRIIKLGGSSNIELQKRMGAAPVMPEMSMLMAIHLNNATVAAVAVEAVIALCDHPHNLTLMHKSNICDNVALIFARYMANKSICDICLQAIDKMSLEEGCRWRLGQANACELTARCLYKHMQIRDTVKHALSTLNGLTFKAFHNQTRFGTYGTCEVVVKVCKAYIGDVEIIREGILAIQALAHRHKINKSKLIVLQVQEFLIEIMRFWASDKISGIAIRYEARDAINVFAHATDESSMDWNILALPPRKSSLFTEISYNEGALGHCWAPHRNIIREGFGWGKDKNNKWDLPCYQNADGRSYNRVYEDSLELSRPSFCRCMTCHIIPGVPLYIPATNCSVTDSIQKTYLDQSPYPQYCQGMIQQKYVSHLEAQYCCLCYPYSIKYHEYCVSWCGNVVYAAPCVPIVDIPCVITLPFATPISAAGEVLISDWKTCCARCCSYPVICGVTDSTRLSEAINRQTERLNSDLIHNHNGEPVG